MRVKLSVIVGWKMIEKDQWFNVTSAQIGFIFLVQAWTLTLHHYKSGIAKSVKVLLQISQNSALVLMSMTVTDK